MRISDSKALWKIDRESGTVSDIQCHYESGQARVRQAASIPSPLYGSGSAESKVNIITTLIIFSLLHSSVERNKGPLWLDWWWGREVEVKRGTFIHLGSDPV